MSTSNVSTDNEHFKSMYNLWWDVADRKLHMLRALNAVTVPFFVDGIRKVGAIKEEHANALESLRGLKVLVVRCGGGLLVEELARLGCAVTGVDDVEEVIKVAKHHAAQDPKLSNLQYEWSTIEDYARRNVEKYDAVIAFEAVEHVEDKKLFLDACVKCLKPGGSIFLTTMNKTNTAWFVFIVLGEYVVGSLPKGTHEWEKFTSLEEMEAMLKDCGCRSVLPTRGISYSFFSGTWYFASNNYACYGLQAVKN